MEELSSRKWFITEFKYSVYAIFRKIIDTTIFPKYYYYINLEIQL